MRDTPDATARADGAASLATIGGALAELADRGIASVYVPHVVAPGIIDDLDPARSLADQVPLLLDHGMPDDALIVALVAGAQVTVGNRFHLGLLSDAHGVPGLFLATSDFDATRVGSYRGGNVDLVPAGDATAGAAAISFALARGRGRPADHWDPAPLLEILRAAVVRGGARST